MELYLLTIDEIVAEDPEPNAVKVISEIEPAGRALVNVMVTTF